MNEILQAVTFDGITTALTAMGVAIVGVALVLKAPSLAKRIISKL